MELRPANYHKDADLLFKWRLDGEQASWYKGRKVQKMKHLQWVYNRVARGSLCKIWIAEVGGEPAGQVRLDSNGEISYYVAPAFRGNGLGAEMVKEACRLSGLSRVKASVDGENEAGIRTLLKAGFVEYPSVKFFLWRPS